MRVVRFVAALSLSAGAALLAGNAFANDRLDGDFNLTDTKCDDQGGSITSTAVIGIGGESGEDSFSVDGLVTGVGTITPPATTGDIVEIVYETELPNKASANDKTGSVSQKDWSQICIYVDTPPVGAALPVGGNFVDICADQEVEKAAVKGKVTTSPKYSGNASLNSSGTELSTFLTGAAQNSITAAFPKGNKCGVTWNPQPSGKKSTLNIKLNNKPTTTSN